jgi:biotin carboxyl carrier protein
LTADISGVITEIAATGQQVAANDVLARIGVKKKK